MTNLIFKKWTKPNTDEVRIYVSGCAAKCWIRHTPDVAAPSADFEVVFTERVQTTNGLASQHNVFNALHAAGMNSYAQILAAAQ